MNEETKLPASAQLEWLWENCNIVYWPEDGNYPIEHNPHTSKYMRDIIEIHMPKANPLNEPTASS